MQLDCKNCGAPILAENVNLDRAIAKCMQCNAVFEFADRFPDRDLSKPRVSCPKNIQVSRDGGELAIVRKWFGPIFFFFAFFALFWNGTTWTFVGIAIANESYFMLAFVSLHFVVGLGILYYTVALLVNSTEIRVNRRYLRVKNAPLPFPGNCTVPVDRIEQLYCKEKISRSRNGSSTTYELYAIVKQGERKGLVRGLMNDAEALFLEWEIERFLRIEDRPIRGEYLP